MTKERQALRNGCRNAVAEGGFVLGVIGGLGGLLLPNIPDHLAAVTPGIALMAYSQTISPSATKFDKAWGTASAAVSLGMLGVGEILGHTASTNLIETGAYFAFLSAMPATGAVIRRMIVQAVPSTQPRQ